MSPMRQGGAARRAGRGRSNPAGCRRPSPARLRAAPKHGVSVRRSALLCLVMHVRQEKQKRGVGWLEIRGRVGERFIECSKTGSASLNSFWTGNHNDGRMDGFYESQADVGGAWRQTKAVETRRERCFKSRLTSTKLSAKKKDLYITMNQLRANDTKSVKPTASSRSTHVKGSTSPWPKHSYHSTRLVLLCAFMDLQNQLTSPAGMPKCLSMSSGSLEIRR